MILLLTTPGVRGESDGTTMNTISKKPFRCKWIFRKKNPPLTKSKVSPTLPVHIDLNAMPKGMDFATLDKIILQRNR